MFIGVYLVWRLLHSHLANKRPSWAGTYVCTYAYDVYANVYRHIYEDYDLSNSGLYISVCTHKWT
jgi:hypothetical protein